jgi:hypothetical protein
VYSPPFADCIFLFSAAALGRRQFLKLDMASSVMSGVQHTDFLQKLGWLGQQFGESCSYLNDLCVQFYNHINSRVFDNEREVTHALNVFKDAVVNTSGGLRSNKTKLFSQIKAILLNPAADVQDHLARFRHSQSISQIRCLLQEGSSVQSSLQVCSKCGNSGGIMTKCSGRRCTAVFHVGCAESTLASKRYSTNYYRCKACSASEIQAAKARRKPKRKRRDDESDHDSEEPTEEADGCAIRSSESDEYDASPLEGAAQKASSDIGEIAADAAEHPTSASAIDRDESLLDNGCTLALEGSSAPDRGHGCSTTTVSLHDDLDLRAGLDRLFAVCCNLRAGMSTRRSRSSPSGRPE